MHKEQITDKEAICLLTIFIMGSSLILGAGGEAKNDAWIAGILGALMAIPIILLYARILSLFPGKDLFEILDLVFGRVAGKIIAVLYIWYSFHLGALVLRNFGEFTNTVAMPETPIIVPMLILGLIDVVLVRSGIEVMGRVSAFMLPVIIAIIAIVQVLTLPHLHLNYLKPVLGNGIGQVLKGGFSAFSFPFAETVLFTGVSFSLKTRKSPYRMFLWAASLAGSIIIFLSMRNIAVLGGLLEKLYFPSHVAVSRISVGNFLQRMEVTVVLVFIYCTLLKSSVCLLFVGKGISSLFKLQDYRSIVIQTGLLMVCFSYVVYDNIMEMQYWAFKVYRYYAFPFQVVLPVILWITVEIKARKKHLPKSESCQ